LQINDVYTNVNVNYNRESAVDRFARSSV
jgi:hypothetical protein